jgi:flagellar assembly protein FliH
LSNNVKKGTQEGKVWTRFEMGSLEAPPLGKEHKADFLSFQVGEKEGATFIPYEQDGDTYGRKREAEDILQEAHKRAAQIEQEAYEKGFSQGEKDGLELGEKKALKVIEGLENLLVEMGNLKQEIIREYEKEILGLIFAISEKIIHHQLEAHQEALKKTVFNAIYFAAEKNNMVLRVNPEDFEYVEKFRPEIFTRFNELRSIVMTSDASITRGGCLLETQYGDIDARIETQLEKIYQCLEGVFNQKQNNDIS